MIVPADAYLAGLRSLCDEFGILLIYDEVVTGMGRTGHFFGFEHAGVVPDMLVLGKGLTAGSQALSAVLVRREADPFAHWTSADPTHLHTLAGNALGCVAGLATIDAIEAEGLVENARLRGLELLGGLRSALRDEPRVIDVRGRGLLVGVELDPRDEDPKSFERRAVLAARELGVLVQGNSGPYAVLVLHPPLTISAVEIERAVGAVADALGRLG
jgi:4-aminobutyrate aminotransferase-like enzyme